MEKVQAMDDLPAQELNPPEIPEPPQPVSTPKTKSQADVEGQGIRRDDQVHGEGAQGGHPCREEGGSAGCQCCSWSHSIGGGRTQEKWRKQIFNVKTFRGMASKGGSKQSY